MIAFSSCRSYFIVNFLSGFCSCRISSISFTSADHSIHKSIESTSISDPLIDPSLVNRLVLFLGGSSDVFSPSSIVS